MKTYKIDNAIVNIRGEVNQDKIREATVIFMKKVYKSKKKGKKHGNRN